MFKENWEKTNITHQLPEGIIEKMVDVAYPNKKLIIYELIPGGCANLNIKIIFENEKYPLILRIYLRDKNSVYREQKLAILLKKTIPIPQIYYIGTLEKYYFSFVEFIPGITLRDLLLSDIQYDLNLIMYDVGTILSRIAIHEFPHAGFFDKMLNVIPNSLPEAYLNFAKDCLKHTSILSVLSPSVVSVIDKIFEQYSYLFPNEREKHLVHGDFDPANILVSKINGVWKITGVLDWEFAFSGSVLWDVANMLRYSYKMAPQFQDAFVRGVVAGGIILPSNWYNIINLLNLLSLLDCLKRSDPKNHPNKCVDICKLIDHILSELSFV